MKKKFITFIADLRFAIFLLLLISLFSILGTIIEQDQPIEIYKINYPLNKPIIGFLSWDKIMFFGLDHLYKTSWFLTLILMFGLSLISCTFLQQIPSIKIARQYQFFRTVKSFNKLKLSTVLLNSNINKFIYQLKILDYSLFQQKNILYCYKGIIGRIGPIFVHVSIIIMLFGTLFSSLTGFKSQEIVPKNEIYHIQNIFNNNKLTQIPNISIRVNDFWITYTKKKTISQFYSDISILDNKGKEIKHKVSFVNSPTIYKNIYYYQTDWNLIGIRLSQSLNQSIEYPLIRNFDNENKIWLTWIFDNQNLTKGFITIIDNLQGYGSLYNNNGTLLGNIELNENLLNSNSLKFIDIISSTGLQIKSDPGIPIIYTGFLFLMINTLISYITYSQIWLIQKDNKIFIGGNTTRATFEFELEFFRLIKSI